MRLELTRVGLLVELANHYTTRGAFIPFQSGLCQFSETPFYSPYITLAETTTTESNDPRINTKRILKAILFYSVGDHLICIRALIICATLRDQMVIKSRRRHLEFPFPSLFE